MNESVILNALLGLKQIGLAIALAFVFLLMLVLVNILFYGLYCIFMLYISQRFLCKQPIARNATNIPKN